MARHQIRAAKPKPEKPKAELRAAPSWYDRTHPVGSAERFLDQAAKEAMVAAAAGGLAEPRQLAAGAVKAVAKKASEYPDPLLQRAAELPAAELAKRAARAEAYNQAMKAQNGVVQAMTASMSPAADLARSQTAAALATRQAQDGGNTMDDVEKMTTAWRHRHDEMERGVKFIGAHDATSTRIPSRQEVREMMSYRGGQGDPDAMLGERMNPLVEAAMFAAGGAPTTLSAALQAAGFTAATMAGIEALSEKHPSAAKVANLALVAASIPGISKAARKALGAAVNDAIAEPTEQKVNLLYEMMRARKSGGPADSPASLSRHILDIHHRRPQGHEIPPRAYGASGHAGSPHARGATGHAQAPAPVSARGTPRSEVPAGSPSRPLPSWWGRFYSRNGARDELVGLDRTSPGYDRVASSLAERLRSAFDARYNDLRGTAWFEDLASRYGEQRARKIASTVASEDFARYMFGSDPAKAIADMEQYSRVNRMIRDIAEPGEIVVGGSSGISQDGTIVRHSAIPHDVDFSGYIANASKIPVPDVPPSPGSEYFTKMAAALSSRENIENAPIVQKLRTLYPELKDAKFRYADRDWQFGRDGNYVEGLFTVPKTSPSFTQEGHGNMLVTTRINGMDVDLMLTDGKIYASKADPRYGSADTAFAWKRQYGRERWNGQMRPKDLADIRNYSEYGPDNPFFDDATGRGRFSAAKFADDMITPEGLPVVADIETYPGGPKIPVMMNGEGTMIEADNPNWLQLFNPEHPINKYSESRANSDSHPLVAVRTLNRPEPSSLEWAGEPSPSIGVFAADSPERLAARLLAEGNPISGDKAPIKVYPKSSIDPEKTLANRLMGGEGYTGYVWDEDTGQPAQLYGKLEALRGEASRSPSPENLGRLGREYMRQMRDEIEHRNYDPAIGVIRNPEFDRIGSGFREYIYRRPDDRWYAGEAKRAGYVEDPNLVDPASPDAHARLTELIRAMRFLAPVAAGAGAAAGAARDPETQQDAKGGRTVRAAQGSQQAEPPVDAEVPAEPLPGPRIVINPTTFKNSKDALCVAFNEGFRLWMEANDFQPQSEPTDAQRKFFSDTAYADDEVQLRRTILARIATFDTSVKDPTDDQLSETASFLNAVLESDWCKSEWERNSVQKLARAVEASVGAEPVEPKAEPVEPRAEEPLQARAALGGGETTDEEDEDEPKNGAVRYVEKDGSYYRQTYVEGETDASTGWRGEAIGKDEWDSAQRNIEKGVSAQRFAEAWDAGTEDWNTQQKEIRGLHSGDRGLLNQTRTLDLDLNEDELAKTATSSALAGLANMEPDKMEPQVAKVPEPAPAAETSPVAETPPAPETAVAESRAGSVVETPVTAPAAKETARQEGDVEQPQNGMPTLATYQIVQDERPSGTSGHTVAERRERRPLRMNGPSIAPVRPIGDIGATSLTDTKHMNGPSIAPVRPIGDIGATSLTDTKHMTGPSIEPERAIGDIDTADGSGGSTLRRKKRRRSRT